MTLPPDQRADVEQRARALLAEVLKLDPATVGPDTSTDTVEQWDSLQQLTIVVSLEEEFGIHFDDEQTVSLVTFPLIVETVCEQLEAIGRG